MRIQLMRGPLLPRSVDARSPLRVERIVQRSCSNVGSSRTRAGSGVAVVVPLVRETVRSRPVRR